MIFKQSISLSLTYAASLFLLVILSGVSQAQIPGSTPQPTPLATPTPSLEKKFFSNILSALPLVKAKKVRALGVSSLKRARAAPEIPTIAESGLPGFYENSWYGVLAPAATSPAIVTRLNTAVVQALKTPAVADRIAQQGAEVAPSSPTEFRDFMRSEIERYAKIIKANGLRVD